MKGEKRTVVPNTVHHIYQRTLDGALIFYSIRDHIVHFTILSVWARKYGLKVLGCCQMPDHLHLSLQPAGKRQLSGFMKNATLCFIKEYNSAILREGPLFESPFGSAPKVKEKKVRENLVYLYNNPVEKELCRFAEEYRWNFLAYAKSDHPFSQPFIFRKASWKMKKAIREVRERYRSGAHLRYRFLERIFQDLCPEEKLQLIDQIVSLYLFIDYQAAIAYYGSYKKMLHAIHTNTGTEHDIKEVFDAASDRAYHKMAYVIQQEKCYPMIRDVTVAPDEEKIRLFRLLQAKTQATGRQIAKFLHLHAADTHVDASPDED